MSRAVSDQLTGTLSGRGEISGSLSGRGELAGGLTIASTAPTYAGPYEFAPTDEVQIVRVAGMKMREDITVAPVPATYGHITWDGAGLRIY